MITKLPENVLDVIENFKDKGFEIYVVGGAVRDMIMGRIVYDWDLTTNASPEKILKILDDAFYDNKYGTVGFKAKDLDRPIEITTYRTEMGYSDNRRPDVIKWGDSLDEDLKRRDFTINAIAFDGKEIIDPYYGQRDIEKKILRAVGDPNERFREDALRMMRAVRIAGELNFDIEEETLNAIQQNASLINNISKERIRDEFIKILKSENPYNGVVHLKNTNIMQEILPELYKCFGVEQKSPNRHHIYDVGTHLLMSLKECRSKDPITRFATLIHDIGKPQTYKKLDTGVITFYNHEMVSTKIATNIADRLKLSNKDKDKLVRLVRYHQFTVGEDQTDSAVRRFIRNVGIENIEDMFYLRTADRLGSGAKETSWRFEDFKKRITEVQKQPFSIKDLKVNGNDIMNLLNLTPGPRVGFVLEKLFKEVDENGLDNNKDVLLEKAKEINIEEKI